MKTDYFDKAAQQFANLMIEKIQQVEDNWHSFNNNLIWILTVYLN